MHEIIEKIKFAIEQDQVNINERIHTSVYDDSENASYHVARNIGDTINVRNQEGKPTVLGLATGSSPIKIYEYLVKFHREESLSFDNVHSFNLDEYYPMQPDAMQSYIRFMREHLFDHIDMPRENIHIPDGTLTPDEARSYCEDYERQISNLGGIDIQLLGIGRTGHIGFNEPGSSEKSRTRLIRLDKITRLDAASDFYGEEHVPPLAITMGVGTIMEAKKIYLVAWGENKAKIIKRAVEGVVDQTVPATFLQNHDNCEFVLDAAAASELTKCKSPWLVRECDWSDQKLVKKAVIWLAQKLGKVVLKLTNEDYNENGMSGLMATYEAAEEINLKVFNQLQHTITGWPGGKPDVDDTTRPERAAPFPKTSLIFSPHPDDDVISMGGTLLRLVDQGHDVHVAYQTSGNIAVFDDDVLRFLEFSAEVFDDDQVKSHVEGMAKAVKFQLHEKKEGHIDSLEIQRLKGLVRKTEANAACRYSGVKEENVHFLNLPFYETGTIKKDPIGPADVERIYHLLEKVKPHQIFAAGDLSDPHGTHRVCLQAIYEAIAQLKSEGKIWLENTYVWLYRGAWQEWDINDIEMAVPLGPKDMLRKKKAIFKHQSQKDVAMFPGSDKREFWQRAEDRNKETALKYDQLGFAEYAAMEAFVRKII
ncbi:MAG: glucosamine-6-phosphate deaminase [Cyclobacteriaceae bacterium]|nr:glucosamine-6-phosphate deaminase [Cyclobacteriaceae bacterium HetDA_MAG_MS6]